MRTSSTRCQDLAQDRRPTFFPEYRTNRRAALTRIEALVLAGIMGLGVVWVLPVLAGNQARSERLLCLNNLRWMGRAFVLWGADHGDGRPFRVRQAEGGTQPDNPGQGKVGVAWFEFAWISNELERPTYLACPSDSETRRVARDFSNRPEGGFAHFNYRNNAVSYFLGLDVYPETPALVLAGDRDVQVDQVPVNCSSQINNASSINFSHRTTSWRNLVHRQSGNLLLNDGSARETSSTEMLQRFDFFNETNGSDHILVPR